MSRPASRLSQAFTAAKEQGRTALVCYAMAGDPSLEATAELLLAIDAAGADVIELGIPFSDPIADGLVLQEAAARALKAGVTLKGVLQLARRLSPSVRAPLVAMGYVNPLDSMGLERFASEAAASGICGVILPDLPLEEATPYREALAAQGVDLVPLVAPTTGPARLAAIARSARGFLYTVTVTGVTGARTSLPDDLASRLRELRALSPVPVAAGFGIAKAEHAAALRGLADGVVVGSALVAAHHQGGVKQAAALVRELRAALS